MQVFFCRQKPIYLWVVKILKGNPWRFLIFLLVTLNIINYIGIGLCYYDYLLNMFLRIAQNRIIIL